MLFHAAAYGAWPSIEANGLRTAAQLFEGAGRPYVAALRADVVELPQPWGAAARLSDQRQFLRGRLDDHLDGIDLAGWAALLDGRVFLYPQQKDVSVLLARHHQDGRDLIVFDTPRVLALHRDRVEVATLQLVSFIVGNGPLLSAAVFEPLVTFPDPVSGIVDVTVVDGIADVGPLVSRVVRYHPDRSTEVLFQR